MANLGFSNSFSGMLDVVLSTPTTPRVAALQSLGPAAGMEGDPFLPVAADSDDRQEARRRIVRGGTLLRDDGVDSDDGHVEQPQQLQYQQLRRQSLLSMFSSSGGGSTPTSVSGGVCQDQASPSERYWRDRASLMGGRCSLEAHAAKLKERRQVQAELRAWVDEVLQGQQQQQEEAQQDSDDGSQQQQQQRLHRKKQVAATQAVARWSDLPAELYYHLTGQQPPASLAASPASPSPSKHHRHSHRHSMQARKNSRATQHLIIEQQQQQVMEQQPQQQLGAVAEQTYSSVNSGDGLYMTPRTAQEFGDSLRQQFEEQVKLQVQVQLQQAAQQWQQANLADQQLVQKLQQEHLSLQLQLQSAHQQIQDLKSKTSPTKAAAKHAGSTAEIVDSDAIARQTAAESLYKTAGGQLAPHEVMSSPSPNVQMLTFLPTDEDVVPPDSGINCVAAVDGQSGDQLGDCQIVLAADLQSTAVQQHVEQGINKLQQVVSATQQQRQTDTAVLVPDAKTRAPSRRTIVDSSAAAATAGSDVRGGVSNSSSHKVRSRHTPGGAKTSRSATARQSSAAAAAKGGKRQSTPQGPDNQLLDVQQQQALLKRLEHAEDVMTMLQQDLQASLAAQQRMTEQLQAARLQLPQCTGQAGQSPFQNQLTEQQEQLGWMSDGSHVHQPDLKAEQQSLQLPETSLQDLVVEPQVKQKLAHRDALHSADTAQSIAAGVGECNRRLLGPEFIQQAANVSMKDEQLGAVPINDGTSVTAAVIQQGPCVHCRELQKVVQQLQVQLQQAGVSQAHPMPRNTSLDPCTVQQSYGIMSNSGDTRDYDHRQHHRQARQVAHVAVVSCPPELSVMSAAGCLSTAAAGDTAYAAAWSSADPAQLSVTQAINIGLLSLAAAAKDDTAAAAGRCYSHCRAPESVMLPGLCRMRPMSARPYSAVGGVVGAAVRSSSGQMSVTTSPFAQSDRAAALLQQLQGTAPGLGSPAKADFNTSEAGQTTRACSAAANEALMISSRQVRAVNGDAVEGARPSSSSAVCFRVRSGSPRQQFQTARSAAVVSVGGGSRVLQAVTSPRRPRTAASIPSRHLAVGLEVRAAQLSCATDDNSPTRGVTDCKACMTSNDACQSIQGALHVSVSSAGLAATRCSSKVLKKPQQVPLLDLARLSEA